MITMSRLRVLLNINKLIVKNYFIKQLHQLLFIFISFFIIISSKAIAQQQTPFVGTSNIYSVVQDKKGFIWLAGQNGLHRFDGEQVINLSNKVNNWSMPFTWINNLSTYDDNLLLSTESEGLWRLNTTTNKAQKINITSESKTFYRALHHKGYYYVVSMAPENLYRYSISTGKTTLIAENITNTQLFSTEGRVYFNNRDKLFILDNENINQPKLINAVSDNITAVSSIKNTIVISTEHELLSINDNNDINSIKVESPISIMTHHNNEDTIFTIDTAGEIIKRDIYTLKPLESSFPKIDNSRYQIAHHDNSGVLWLGNYKGLQQVVEVKVKNHIIDVDTRYSHNESEIYQGNVYIGSYGEGIHHFSLNDKNLVSPFSIINDVLPQRAKITTDMLTINNKLYIATFDGLWTFNQKTQITKKVNLSFNQRSFNDIVLLKLRKVGQLLYIATDGEGLLIYDLNTENVQLHINKNQGLSSGEVIDVLPLTGGDIWLATATGIDIVNTHTNRVRNLAKQTNAKFLNFLKIKGKIFVSTTGNGILVYSLQGELLANFAKGIHFNQMSYIDGNILASAKPGLYKINPDNYQFSMFTNTEELSFTDGAIMINDALYIANDTGILKLPRVSNTTFHPPVYISKTTVSGESYLLNKVINIDSGNDVITLELASLDYRPGLAKQYRYTLNGNKWHNINGNQLTLTGLASGEYYIEIMATNSLGQWSDFKAFTQINVAYPWYWSPQIRLVYSVFFIGILLLTAWLLYLRSKSISHIHNILKTDIRNQGKVSLQVKRNLIFAKGLFEQGEIAQAESLLTECISELNNQQLSEEPNTLDGKTLSVAIPFLVNYLQHKYQVNLTYQLNIKDELLSYELQADLYRAIFEAITCVVLKDSGRNFKVILQLFKDKVWLNIYDDKQGFTHFDSKVNFDISMYYIRQITNKHNGSINSFNDQGGGSQLVISLPIK